MIEVPHLCTYLVFRRGTSKWRKEKEEKRKRKDRVIGASRVSSRHARTRPDIPSTPFDRFRQDTPGIDLKVRKGPHALIAIMLDSSSGEIFVSGSWTSGGVQEPSLSRRVSSTQDQEIS